MTLSDTPSRAARRRAGTFLIAAALLLGACSKAPPASVAPAAADSVALRARADSLASARRHDSVTASARADSLVRARADSLARAAEAHRADSVRAQILRDSTDAAPGTASGLDAGSEAAIAATVSFELDRSDLSADAQRLLDRKVAILRLSPRLELQVEGHCDERGPDEYNLALGNRRAASVKRYLVDHGIADARLTIISYGEERPADPRPTEEAWAKNRRAEFRVTRGAR